MRRCSAGAREESRCEVRQGEKWSPWNEREKPTKQKQKEKGAYFSKCHDERKRLGPTNSRNSKAEMRWSPEEIRYGGWDRSPNFTVSWLCFARRVPAATSRGAALFGCTSVPDMFYLAGCRLLDCRYRLLLSLPHLLAANGRCRSKFLPAYVQVRQPSRGLSAITSCVEGLMRFGASWKTQTDVCGRY